MSTTSIIISAILTLLLVIVLYIFILPQSKRASLNTFFQMVHDFLNIRRLMVESIFRFIYVCCVVFCIIFGFIYLFEDFKVGIMLILLGPIASRIVFESLLLVFILTRNVMDINNHLKGIDSTPEKTSSVSFGDLASKFGQTIQNITTSQTAPQAPVPGQKVCSKCGKPISGESAFCIYCGQKVDE